MFSYPPGGNMPRMPTYQPPQAQNQGQNGGQGSNMGMGRYPSPSPGFYQNTGSNTGNMRVNPQYPQSNPGNNNYPQPGMGNYPQNMNQNHPNFPQGYSQNRGIFINMKQTIKIINSSVSNLVHSLRTTDIHLDTITTTSLRAVRVSKVRVNQIDLIKLHHLLLKGAGALILWSYYRFNTIMTIIKFYIIKLLYS